MRPLRLAALALAAILPLSARAIIGGSPDTGHPAAVAVWVTGAGSYTLCSGVLVGQALLLTHAFCVAESGTAIEPGRVQVHLGASTAAGSEPSALGAQIWLHPSWTGAGEYGAALVRLDRPLPAASVATLAPATLGATDHGSAVTLVGYGDAAWNSAFDPARRSVAATVVGTTTESLSVGTEGATACAGDMGASVFRGAAGQELIGMVINTALACAGPSGALQASFLAPFIEAHQPPASSGSGGCAQAAGGAPLALLLTVAALLRPRLCRRGALRA